MRLIITTLILASNILACYADTDTEQMFIWNEANSHMFTAHKPDDFIRAADAYNKLIKYGVRNAPLFYNLGTALLKAGHYTEATSALRRAELYSGTNWEIKRNLLIANSSGNTHELIPLPWYRHPLFWHFGLGISTRITITVCSFALIWACLIFKTIGASLFSRTLIIPAMTILILFGSSTLTSIHQELTAPSLNIEKLIHQPANAQPIDRKHE